MKRILFIISLFLAGMMTVQAQEVDFNSLVGSDESGVTFNFNDAWDVFDGVALGSNTMSGGGITLSTTNPGNSPVFTMSVVSADRFLQVPSGGTLRLKADSYYDYLTNIQVETADGSTPTFYVNEGNVDGGTWTGQTKSVTLTFSDQTDLARITAQKQTLYRVNISSYGPGITSYGSTEIPRQMVSGNYQGTATVYLQPGESLTFSFVPDDERRYIQAVSLDWSQYDAVNDTFNYSTSEESDITTQAQSGSYTLSNPVGDYYLQVNYNLQYPLITYSASGGGTITLNGTYLDANDQPTSYPGDAVRDDTRQIGLAYGADLAFTLTPDVGFELSSLMLNDTADVTSQVVDNVYSVSNLTQPMKLEATFVSTTPQAYAVLDGATLTFFYDTQMEARGGFEVEPFSDYTERGWHSQRASITTVVFDSTFANCTSLTSTAFWFYELSNLTSIQGIANLNTANVTSMSLMFWGCSSLTSLDLSSLSTANVTMMDQMFGSCSGLTSLNVSGFNTTNVTIMPMMFNNCSGLTTLDLSGFNTAGVTDMGGMFLGCSALTTIYVGNNWSTAAVDESGDMFTLCNALVGGAFTAYDANNADATYAHIDGGTANPGYLTSIADMAAVAAVTFSRSMYELTMSCTTANVHIMYAVITDPTATPEYQLYTAPITLTTDCTVQAYAIRPSGIQSTTTSYEFSMSDVQTVVTPTMSWSGDNLTLATTTADATIHYILDDGTEAAEEQVYTAPVAVTADVVISAWATRDEYNNSDTLSVDYPYTAWAALAQAIANAQAAITAATGNSNVPADSLTALQGKIDEANAAYTARTAEASAITALTASVSATTDYVVSKANAVDEPYAVLDGGTLTFYFDKQKEERDGLDINAGWGDSAATITNVVFDATFANCTTLTSTASWFENCTQLTQITLTDRLNTANVTDMSNMFAGCTSLRTIYVTADWSTAAVTDGSGMFTDCTALVGGAFTAYDADNADAAYARIDGGTANPGYLTSIADTAAVAAVTFSRDMYELTMNCTTANVHIMYAVVTDPTAAPQYQQYTAPITLTTDCTVQAYAIRPSGIQSAEASYVFQMSDVQTVEVPTMSWSGNHLTLATTTADATIHYTLDDGATAATEQVYTAPVTVTSDVTISAWATKTGFNNSDTLTVDYPYTAWAALAQAIADAQSAITAATGNDNVPADSLTALQAKISAADSAYNARTAEASAITAMTAAMTASTEIINQLATAVDEPYAVLDGTTLTFYYDKRKEERGGMSVGPFVGYPDYQSWYAERETITTVVFDASFANCTTLTSTAYWFQGCINLTSIQGIANLNTANVTDMVFMFEGCTSLTSLDLNGFNTANVTSMYGMFNGCSGLTSLDVSGFNTANVTQMSAMFSNCSSLTSIDLTDFNTANVTDMPAMFNGCIALRTIYVGEGWSTSAVTTSSAVMFGGCTSLVGGAFTAYDSNHTDHNYAHIDGGTSNPGYLTSIADNAPVAEVTFSRSLYELTMSCATENVHIMYAVITDPNAELQWQQYTAPITLTSDCTVRAYAVRPSGIQSDPTEYTFSMSDVQTVATPTMSWSGDEMTLATTTADATIHYTLDDGATAAQEQVFTAPVTVTSDVTISAWATKDGFNNSDTLTVAYPYTAWAALVQAIADAQSAITAATGNDNVPADSLTALQAKIAAADSAYTARTAEASAITAMTSAMTASTEIINQLAAAEKEAYAVLSGDGLTVTFYYDYQKSERGGINLNSSYIDDTTTSPYGSATIAIFDSSFADYLPTTTEYWFMGCSSLTEISGISNLNTTNVTDMRHMFAGCSSLTSLDVSGFNTANVVFMDDMFNHCSALTSLDLRSFNTANVRYMDSMFSACFALTNLDVSSFNTANVTSMYSMFQGCYSLTSLDVSGFDTGNVTNMSSMFLGCSALTSLDVSGFNTDNVTDMSHMFDGCSGVTSLNVSGFNTANVTDMSAMFWSCSGLTSLDVSSFNTANVASMSHFLRNCSGLTNIDLSGFSTANVTDMTEMFGDCSGLTSLDLSGFNTASVTYMSSMFASSPNLTTIYVGENWSTAAVTEGDHMFYGCTSLVGGAFTAYDESRINSIYARIDGGTDNPGYLTSIADTAAVAAVTFSRSMYELTMSCATENVHIMYAVITDPNAELQWQQYTAPITLTSDCTVRAYAVRPSGIQSDPTEYTFSMSDVQTVATPTMSWSSDEMTLATTTADATIHYTLDDGTTAAQEQVYTAPVTVTSDVTISAWATKDGFNNSDTLTVAYPYTAWAALLQAIADAQSAITAATGNDNVPADSLTALQAKIAAANTAYTARTAEVSAITAMTSAMAASTEIINQLAAAENEPYAVLSDNNTVLTFYYDKKKEERGGMSVGPFNDYTDRGWDNVVNTITTVTFDSSFANCTTLTSTANWFYDCYYLTSIQGIANLNTAHVTSMMAMFGYCSNLTSLDVSGFNTTNVTDMNMLFLGCSSLTSLDLSNFNTANVTDMNAMFSACSNLTRIYVGEGWSTASVTIGSDVFTGCTALVGGQGTVFDGHNDYTYAHIDGGTQNPGYLTLALAMGDANGDGAVNIADAVATVTNILGEAATGNFYSYAADMNVDGVVDIFDVTLIVNDVLNAPAPAPAMGDVTRTATLSIPAEAVQLTAADGQLAMDISQAERYTAFQLDVTLPAGMSLFDVRLSAATDHQLSFVHRGDNQYRVVALSMSNQTLRSADGRLLQLILTGSADAADVKVGNVIFVTPAAQVSTGIQERMSTSQPDADTIYNLNGQKVAPSQLGKGVYIINHKKVIKK